MQEHEVYMRRCLELAPLGMGSVSPNPMVGALLVHDGKVVAENYHQRYGGPHAEVLVVEEVIRKYGSDAAALFRDSTMYVSLEPCAHHGKTPPCANLLAQHQLKEVVVACRDPFGHVNGQGITIMEEAGIRVTEGILADASRWLNRRFFTRISEQRPYVILKWAQTADGYMAPADRTQRWITGAEAKQLVHRWRSEEDAVLVGVRTAIADNPKLNVREWQGRNPKRVLIDKDLVVSESAHLLDGSTETIVLNATRTDWKDNVKYLALEDFDWYLPQKILFQLYLMDIQSIIVEGGRKTLDLFIGAGLWDEARVFTSSHTWGDGIPAPRCHAPLASSQQVGADRLNIYYRNQHNIS